MDQKAFPICIGYKPQLFMCFKFLIFRVVIHFIKAAVRRNVFVVSPFQAHCHRWHDRNTLLPPTLQDRVEIHETKYHCFRRGSKSFWRYSPLVAQHVDTCTAIWFFAFVCKFKGYWADIVVKCYGGAPRTEGKFTSGSFWIGALQKACVFCGCLRQWRSVYWLKIFTAVQKLQFQSEQNNQGNSDM